MANDIVLLCAGVMILLVGWLPLALRRLPMTLPLACMAGGVAGGAMIDAGPDYVALVRTEGFCVLAQVALVLALLGAGLRIDRPFGLRRWNSVWRLIGVGMPLMAILIIAVGRMAGIPLAGCVLIAGILTPTDPVLASAVSVGPPGSGAEGEVRFALAGEAGLNDGLAFPIVLTALALLQDQPLSVGWFAEKFLVDVILSVASGWLIGRLLGWLLFRLPRVPLSDAANGLVAIGSAFSAYAIAELIGAYGFIAVFVTALTLRATCPEAAFHRAMNAFAEQIERLAAMSVLLMFGAGVARGLLAPLSWPQIAFVAAVVFVARPLAVLVAMIASPLPLAGRLVLAFFGVRGLATLFYLAANANALLILARPLMAMTGLAVAMSIVVHGIAAPPVMAWLDRRRLRARDAQAHPHLDDLVGETFTIKERAS
ncbi:cation:proton antiporter [Novosphingobium profundi]|uniref:cation:proton antiporter n=1 Tax=Novosphingobium profundi TaxID=1774954 RepID=UPI001BD9CE27|nr:cation:proton antiporter [Novosphingobium profundi]MBT0670618.1 cation:proton antiporter [Novosphingobium profundi]